MSLSRSSVQFANNVDKLIQKITLTIAWVYVLLIITIISQVFMRYVLGTGHPMMEELQWHFYAIGIMFGLSYSQTLNSHIRVDVVAGLISKKSQLSWEVFGILFLALPFVFVVFYNSLDFFYESWRVNESSDAPVGLPWRWLIKGVIPVSFFFLGVTLLTRLIRVLVELFDPSYIAHSKKESHHGH
jgi:TRAP-type mannitol/chloroaromatic compound transport system permease small subunit